SASSWPGFATAGQLSTPLPWPSQSASPTQQPPPSTFSQPTAGAHVSGVHSLESSQSTGVPPTHPPLSLQVSPAMQRFPSSQAFPSGTKPLSWHAVPTHVSWFSQLVVAPPHGVPSGAGLPWQEPDPSHVSGSSQSVSEPSPHAVPADAKPLSVHPPDPS